VLASVHEHTEFVVDSFRNVQPMKLSDSSPNGYVRYSQRLSFGKLHYLKITFKEY